MGVSLLASRQKHHAILFRILNSFVKRQKSFENYSKFFGKDQFFYEIGLIFPKMAQQPFEIDVKKKITISVRPYYSRTYLDILWIFNN